jgi:hypothetical protein
MHFAYPPCVLHARLSSLICSSWLAKGRPTNYHVIFFILPLTLWTAVFWAAVACGLWLEEHTTSIFRAEDDGNNPDGYNGNSRHFSALHLMCYIRHAAHCQPCVMFTYHSLPVSLIVTLAQHQSNVKGRNNRPHDQKRKAERYYSTWKWFYPTPATTRFQPILIFIHYLTTEIRVLWNSSALKAKVIKMVDRNWK